MADTADVRGRGSFGQSIVGIVPEVEAGEMTPEIQWDYGSDVFSSPTRRDCEAAEWTLHALRRLNMAHRRLWWETVIDMMLHGY